MSGGKKRKQKGGGGGGGGWDFPDLSGLDGEGLVVLLALGVALITGFLVVELLAPALMFAAYALLTAALRRVANDRHGCEGSLPRAIAWGALWATLYTLPLAAVIAAIHYAL